MSDKELHIIPVELKEDQKLLDIGRETFYNSFGPPINSEKDIQDYLNKKFTLKQINRELEDPNSEFYFAKISSQIVGYLKVNYGNAQTEKIKGNSLEIERIYVIKALQGKKIGLQLFKKALTLAQSKKLNYIWLGVWEENTRAIKFYERNGFKAFDVHPFILGTSVQKDVMMKLNI